jgi:hypothetical protein
VNNLEECVTGIEQCQARQARIQRNHIACAFLVWTRLSFLAQPINAGSGQRYVVAANKLLPLSQGIIVLKCVQALAQDSTELQPLPYL